MDDNEFFNALKPEASSGIEFAACAEYLVNLKRQVGYEKTAGVFSQFMTGAKTGLKYQGLGTSMAAKGLKHPSTRATAAGALAGQIAPAAAVGAAGYALGKSNHNHDENQHEKLAGFIDRLKGIDQALIAPAAVMGAIGAGSSYLSHKPRESLEGKSKREESLGHEVDLQNRKPETGFLEKLRHRTTEMEHGYAKAFREHPAKATALGAASGIGVGYGLARLGGARSIFGGVK